MNACADAITAITCVSLRAAWREKSKGEMHGQCGPCAEPRKVPGAYTCLVNSQPRIMQF